jgi:hypothetical protein
LFLLHPTPHTAQGHAESGLTARRAWLEGKEQVRRPDAGGLLLLLLLLSPRDKHLRRRAVYLGLDLSSAFLVSNTRSPQRTKTKNKERRKFSSTTKTTTREERMSSTDY